MEDQDTRDIRRLAIGCGGVILLLLAVPVSMFFLVCPRGICLAAGGRHFEMFAHSVDVCEMPEGRGCPRYFTRDEHLPDNECRAEGWVAPLSFP